MVVWRMRTPWQHNKHDEKQLHDDKGTMMVDEYSFSPTQSISCIFDSICFFGK